MPWTRFMDMQSGGGTKEPPYEYILIEAPEDEAKVIFYNRFGHNPERVTCTCCGNDYSISEDETLEEATAYDRGAEFDPATGVDRPSADRFDWHKYRTLEDYLKSSDVLVIRATEIKEAERRGSVPAQGFVWVE